MTEKFDSLAAEVYDPMSEPVGVRGRDYLVALDRADVDERGSARLPVDCRDTVLGVLLGTLGVARSG